MHVVAVSKPFFGLATEDVFLAFLVAFGKKTATIGEVVEQVSGVISEAIEEQDM